MVGAIMGPAVHQTWACCAFPLLLATTEERGGWIGMAAARERPAIVTVRLRSASSCPGRSRPNRTCSVWRRTPAPARGRAPARVRRRRWPRLRPLHRRLHWRHRTRPLTDPPPDAFSTWDRWRNRTFLYKISNLIFIHKFNVKGRINAEFHVESMWIN